jgi:crotonobetainyl-CoA:carnitine CoA-transferase CaiB-like acyl-CoA transferase
VNHDPVASVSDHPAAPPPLAGLRVVECGEGVSAAFAAKTMADLGAAVIKVEPPQGDITRRRGPFPGHRADPEKSGLFIYLNGGKLGVALDLTEPAGRDTLAHLLEDADLLIHNLPVPERRAAGLDRERLRADFPRLVTGAISPFGDSGPYRDWKSYELNLVNAGGWAYLSPGSSQHPELPPLKVFGSQADFQAGLHVCFATLAAFWGRLRTGRGEHLEVSGQECITAMLELSFAHYSYAGQVASRLGRRAVAPWTIMGCADGYIMILCIEEAQWGRMVEMMGDPEWAHEEIFATGRERSLNSEALYALMDEWVRGWKVRDFFLEAQRRRIPVAPVSTLQDLYANDQLSDRQYFVPIEVPGVGRVSIPGAPFKSSAGGWAVRGAAPSLEQPRADQSASWKAFAEPRFETLMGGARQPLGEKSGLPLSGIRVLDLTWVWAGPYCTLQFAHMGADVLRIESSHRLCPTRRVPPFADGVAGVNRAGYFNQYSQGKRSVTLNLTAPEGVRIALELARHCDVVADNFSAGAMDRMGLGYQALRAVKPDIIMVSMSGYGQTGPWRNFLSYGPPAAAFAGFFALTGYEGMGPSEVGVSFADPTAGMFGTIAVMAALFHRARTGAGQFIDLSQMEATIATLPEGIFEFAFNRLQPARAGNHDPLMAPHECYKAAGDEYQWVSIAVGNQREWRALCEAIDEPQLAADPRFATAAERKRNENELDRIITRWTSTRDRWEITRRLQSRGVAAFPSMSSADIASDPHMTERGFLVNLPHPEVGRRIHPGIPWSMAETKCAVRSPAPLLGADTDAVLREVLGMSAAEIERLRSSDVLS